MLFKTIGKTSLYVYRQFVFVRSKIFSILISGSFHKYGRRTVIVPPLRISGEDRIDIGSRVFIGGNSWLLTMPDDRSPSVMISIGDGSSIVGSCVISSAHQIILENNVLLARNVYISDHMHKYSDLGVPILAQGLDKIAPVLIRRGAWIGQNVVICPGVTIGTGSVIGANSVVNTDVPDFCLAAGAPAQVVKKLQE